MIDVGACDRKADAIDDAVLNIIQIINKCEDSLYYVNQNKSKDATVIAQQLELEISNLQSEKNRLSSISSTIRSRAREIYEEELEEQRRREREEELRREALREKQMLSQERLLK